MTKVQIGPLISEEAKAMYELMAYDDRRSKGNWLEWMIRQEYARRLESKLSGSSIQYHGDMREKMNDMRRQVAKREAAEREAEQKADGE